MTYAIVYSSRTGNTAQLAKALPPLWAGSGPLYCGAPDDAALAVDLILVGFWTDKGGCDQQTAAFLPQLHGKTVALFGTAGFGGSRDYFDRILERVAALAPSDARLLPGFMCQGKMPESVGQRYRQMLKDDPGNAQAQAMLQNFDAARSHPDARDLTALKRWALALVQGL